MLGRAVGYSRLATEETMDMLGVRAVKSGMLSLIERICNTHIMIYIFNCVSA